MPVTFRLLPDWTPRDIRKLLSDSSIEAAAIADNVWVAMPHLPRFTVLQNKSKGVSFNLSDAPALQVRFVYPLHNFCLTHVSVVCFPCVMQQPPLNHVPGSYYCSVIRSERVFLREFFVPCYEGYAAHRGRASICRREIPEAAHCGPACSQKSRSVDP